MEPEKIRQAIAAVVDMDDEAWETAIPMFRLKELRKKEFFLKQGEVCRYIGFINKGYVRLYYDMGDEEVTKDFNTEYSFCGSYASFISESPSHFNVVAMEPLQVFVVNRASLLTLTERYMSWQKFLRIGMENIFIRKENREAMFLTATPKERYFDLMNNHPDWINRIPLKYLASYLGVTPETLSRIRREY